jgi:catechol 2,3-dioxygenase-like lactoylglutathione lyase family enzyme
MPKNFELTGPAFVGFLVRDVKVSAEFYKKTLGFRRDPEGFQELGLAVSFMSYPVPFAVRQAPEGVDLDKLPRPIPGPAVWFKTANSQVVYDALVAAGVTILRPIAENRFGRNFAFQDPDGYMISIYDRDAPPEGWEIRSK